MQCSNRYVNLALLLMALRLMAGSLGGQEKAKQSPGNPKRSELPSEPSREPKQDSKELCTPRASTMRTAPALEITLACMSQAALQNQTRLRPYTVTREYELFGQERDNARSRVIADVIFLPPDSKDYRIQRTEGSMIGERIVRRVLEKEAAITKDGHSKEISQDNYEFRFLREEVASGQRCYVLQLLPRRKDKNLLCGAVWIDADTYLIRRIEGEPQRSPSWWVRDIHIVLSYADVAGMWLPTYSEYTAKVRLLGLSTMLAHDLKYSYSQFAEARSEPTGKTPASEQAGEHMKVAANRPTPRREDAARGSTRGSEVNATLLTGTGFR
ncbi:MAG TPA: hypothetical protein VG204_20365 [Terriglobia bacterium]|nr:hypothetical protein [Terriglobia bacterium]